MHSPSAIQAVVRTHTRDPRTALRSRVSKAVVALALVAGGFAAPTLISPQPAHALDPTTFTYTGAEQLYTVPAGISQVTITAIGGKGSNPYGAGGTSGYGATVTATVTLPAGTTTLYVEVGGNGGTFVDNGGWNGGGQGAYYGTLASAGGGGGASDVRTQPRTTALSTTDTRLVVAGGGGGGGRNNACATQPDGGEAGLASITGAGIGGAGDYGAAACTYNAAPYTAVGGDGGFGSPGGAAGTSATAGTLGQGGAGGGYFWGGGGGGGYYGGGGGATGNYTGGGGGGGSSFWVTGSTGTSMSTDTTGVPSITITPLLAAPDTPTNVVATKTARGEASLTWTDHGTALDSHTVEVYGYKKGNAKRPPAYTPISTHTSGPGNTWTISGLPGGVYVFKVSATNVSGTSVLSAYSNAVRV